MTDPRGSAGLNPGLCGADSGSSVGLIPGTLSG